MREYFTSRKLSYYFVQWKLRHFRFHWKHKWTNEQMWASIRIKSLNLYDNIVFMWKYVKLVPLMWYVYAYFFCLLSYFHAKFGMSHAVNTWDIGKIATTLISFCWFRVTLCAYVMRAFPFIFDGTPNTLKLARHRARCYAATKATLYTKRQNENKSRQLWKALNKEIYQQIFDHIQKYSLCCQLSFEIRIPFDLFRLFGSNIQNT